MRSFEQEREHLSHDRFNTGFLASIAFTGDPSNRDQKLEEAFAGRPERIDQIRRAFDEWPAVRSEIQTFLMATETRYGWVSSDLFREDRLRAVAALDLITRFGKRFVSAQAEKAEKKDLADLWTAVDVIAGLLKRMGTHSDLFFVDFDPDLIKDDSGVRE